MRILGVQPIDQTVDEIRDMIGDDDLFVGKYPVDDREHEGKLDTFKDGGKNDKNNRQAKAFLIPFDEGQ